MKFTCSTQVHIKYKIFQYFKLLNKKKKTTISNSLLIFFQKTILLHHLIDFFEFRTHIQVIVNSVKTLQP